MYTLLPILLLAVSAYGTNLEPDHSEPRRYIVKLKSSELAGKFAEDFDEYRQSAKKLPIGHVEMVSQAETGSSLTVMNLNRQSLEMVRNHPSVEYVEEDGLVELEVEIGAGRLLETRGDDVSYWGLDRINQKTLPLDGNVSFIGDGTGVNIYIIDSGVMETHSDFGGRVKAGFDVFDSDGQDCLGHGTQVAGVAAGKTYGVAKGATIHSVRTLDCNGVARNSQIARSIDWVAEHGESPCVATIALSTRSSKTIDAAIQRLAESGCLPVTAASNEVKDRQYDACVRSPARSPYALTVGASKADDSKAWFSRYGICVDIFAPGYDIRTTSKKGDDEFLYARGTSLSCPFVAGVAAIHLGNGVPQDEVRERILNDATVCEIPDAGRGSPNRLLYVDPGRKK
ncbi:aqualysin-1-like [Asterias amurensis]|uniref:aqualysin-1-like n=1 Tax=Asterias amurensis TaxID=7602 RepID=UPI003AB7ABC6